VADTITPVMQHTQQQTAKAAIAQAKAKYKDFEQHIPAMIEISQRNPQLNYDDLYKLATYDKRNIPVAKQTMKPGVRHGSARVDPTTLKGLTPWEKTLRQTEADLAAMGEKVTLFRRK